ncbi:MAG: hypothetical protein IAF38_12050 [Bacteroidia bacterium]|nr:hypothetical protein [Bacteroidia bacterium]
MNPGHRINFKKTAAVLVVITISFLMFGFAFKTKKPEVRFMGTKKGTIDKLTFIAAKKLELNNNPDTLWQIVGYEFDFNCSGNVILKYYKTDKIEREILEMVRDCKAEKSLADFINIKAKNKKTGEEIVLNEIELSVLK